MLAYYENVIKVKNHHNLVNSLQFLLLPFIYFFSSGISPNPFEMRGLGESLNDRNGLGSAKRRSPHAFLGENSGLVNLDNLVTKPTQPQQNQQQPLRPGMFIFFSPLFFLIFISKCSDNRLILIYTYLRRID